MNIFLDTLILMNSDGVYKIKCQDCDYVDIDKLNDNKK